MVLNLETNEPRELGPQLQSRQQLLDGHFDRRAHSDENEPRIVGLAFFDLETLEPELQDCIPGEFCAV